MVLVTAAGSASGSKAAAAALACAGSEPDRPSLMIDVGGRPPRPTLVASSGARELEERLAVHLPQLRAASRGQTCHLALPGGRSAFDSIRAASPLVRESIAVVHLPPALLQEALADAGVRARGVLLRADLARDRALTALAVRDLLDCDLRVAVLKQPLAWIPSRRALFGVLPADAPGGLPGRLRARLVNPVSQRCYASEHDAETDPEGAPQREWRGDEGA